MVENLGNAKVSDKVEAIEKALHSKLKAPFTLSKESSNSSP